MYVLTEEEAQIDHVRAAHNRQRPFKSGSPGALLHRGPLRSVRVTRRDIRLKQALMTARAVRCT